MQVMVRHQGRCNTAGNPSSSGRRVRPVGHPQPRASRIVLMHGEGAVSVATEWIALVAPSQEEKKALRRQAVEHVVLVAEDNDLNFELISAVLERDGIGVRWARDGLQAVSASLSDHPDLLILDLHLPELSGIDVLKRVRANPLTCALPVLVLTADAMVETIEEVLREGATGVVTKPFDLNALRATIARLLK